MSGQQIRVLSCGTIAAHEPESHAPMLAGPGVVGIVARRRLPAWIAV
jgi:hypothetical protein